jgi:hypothetical protein
LRRAIKRLHGEAIILEIDIISVDFASPTRQRQQGRTPGEWYIEFTRRPHQVCKDEELLLFIGQSSYIASESSELRVCKLSRDDVEPPVEVDITEESERAFGPQPKGSSRRAGALYSGFYKPNLDALESGRQTQGSEAACPRLDDDGRRATQYSRSRERRCGSGALEPLQDVAAIRAHYKVELLGICLTHLSQDRLQSLVTKTPPTNAEPEDVVDVAEDGRERVSPASLRDGREQYSFPDKVIASVPMQGPRRLFYAETHLPGHVFSYD